MGHPLASLSDQRIRTSDSRRCHYKPGCEGCNTRIFSGDWDFGDGAFGTTFETSSITHTFTEPGTYTTIVNFDADRVSVEVTDFIVEFVVLETDIVVDPGDDPADPLINLIVSSFAIDTEVTSGGVETVSARRPSR